MNIVVAILSFNPLSNLRSELVRSCVMSAKIDFVGCKVILFDNGSTDGSDQFLTKLAAKWHVEYVRGEGSCQSPGAGRNHIMKLPAVRSADVVVLSDDDMEWKSGAGETVEKLWSNGVSDRILIVSGLLEPVWHWNTPRLTVSRNGINVLVRDSAPAAAWTLRVRDWPAVGPLREELGEDHDACQRLRQKDFLVAQVDLAKHNGADTSIWGNDAETHLNKRPLDREKWQV